MTAKIDKGTREAASEKRKLERPPIKGKNAAGVAGFAAGENLKAHWDNLRIHYRLRATYILWEDTRFAWLADHTKMNDGTGKCKEEILSELGRIPDQEDLKVVALRICELQPKTKAAVAMIHCALADK